MSEPSAPSKPHTVVVVLEAKPGKESQLKQALVDVIEPSRAENTCLEYRLHQDITNPAQFVLYENWENQQKHQQQFTKPYVTTLANKLENLLAKPYQAIFAEEI